MTKELENLARILRDPLSGLTWNNRTMAANAIDNLTATRTGAVKVKALEWGQPDGPEGTAWLGHGVDMCEYYIRFDVGTASYWLPGDRPPSDDDDSAEEFLALDEAKAAAQADYERRILSALSPAPEAQQEPVAYEDNAKLRDRIAALEAQLADIRTDRDRFEAKKISLQDDVIPGLINRAEAAESQLDEALKALEPFAEDYEKRSRLAPRPDIVRQPTCIACDDKPIPPNDPCAVCGTSSRPAEQAVTEAMVRKALHAYIATDADTPEEAMRAALKAAMEAGHD